jgi:hypothetical protein
LVEIDIVKRVVTTNPIAMHIYSGAKMLLHSGLTQLLPPSLYKLSPNEAILLEANLFVRVTERCRDLFQTRYKAYYALLKNEKNKDNLMTEKDFMKCLVSDIVSTNEYTLEGIAHYTRMPLDVIVEIVTGVNDNPSLILASKIISLHAHVRRNLYDDLIKKVVCEAIS